MARSEFEEYQVTHVKGDFLVFLINLKLHLLLSSMELVAQLNKNNVMCSQLLVNYTEN